MCTMRNIVTLIAVFVASATLSSAQDTELRALATSLASQVKEKGKGPVAITAFANANYGPEFSIFLVDRLNVLLSRGNGDFDVVARDRVEEAFKEINLALGKNFDSLTFARIGKQIGARSLIRGSYTVQPAGAVVSIVAQIVDVETGRIIGGDLAEVRYTGDIKTMLTPRDASAGTPLSNGSDSTSVSPATLSRPAPNPTGARQSSTSQADAIKVTAGEVGVTSEAFSAALSVIVENASKEPIYLALQNTFETNGTNGVAALSDDKGTAWQFVSLSGIERLPLRTDQKYNEVMRASENYTLIPPGGRTAIVMHFRNNGNWGNGTYIGSLFSFSAQGVRYAATGPSRFSIGLTGIKGTVVKQ